MRPKMFSISTASTGQTPWHMLDYRTNPFSVSFFCDTNGGTGSYVVEHGFSDMKRYPIVADRATTTVTVQLPSHGLGVGDNVVISGCGVGIDGTYAVASIPTANTFTYTVADSGVTYGTGSCLVIRVFPHSVVGTAQTTDKDGNYAFPINFIRMRITVSGAGVYSFLVNQGSN